MAMNFIWAVDPYEMDLRPTTEVVNQLRTLVGGSLRNATPVFVRGNMPENPIEERTHLEEYFRSFVQEPTQTPQIIYTGSTVRKDWGKLLLDFAVDKKAEMVVLSSHGRGLVARLLLGSFAETLLAESPVPLLFLPRYFSNKEGLKSAAFATDFSPQAKIAFDKFIHSFGEALEEINLLHSISLPEGAGTVAGVSGLPIAYPETYRNEQKKWAEEQSMKWLEEARARGIHCRFNRVLLESILINTSTAIESFVAKHDMGIVGLASHDTTMTKFMLGSVTQELLQKRSFPLWACGPSIRI